MGTVEFQGVSPFALPVLQGSSATGTQTFVTAYLEVSVAGRAQPVSIQMRWDQAATLAEQLRRALQDATT